MPVDSHGSHKAGRPSLASGVLLDKSGYLLSACHIGAASAGMMVQAHVLYGDVVQARAVRVVFADPATDLVLLQIIRQSAADSDDTTPTALNALPLCAFGFTVKAGQRVCVMGLAVPPGGQRPAFVEMRGEIMGLDPNTGEMILDMTGFRGISGAAVRTEDGRVVGIFLQQSRENPRVCYARVLTGGSPERAFLGRAFGHAGLKLDLLETDEPEPWEFSPAQRDTLEQQRRSNRALTSIDLDPCDFLDDIAKKIQHLRSKPFVRGRWLPDRLCDDLDKAAGAENPTTAPLDASSSATATASSSSASAAAPALPTIICLYGDAGTGKSAFLLRLMDKDACTEDPWRKLHKRILARHVCSVYKKESLDPDKWARSLAAQLIQAVLEQPPSARMTIASLLSSLNAQQRHRKFKDERTLWEWVRRSSASTIMDKFVVPVLHLFGGPLGGRDILLLDSLDEALTLSVTLEDNSLKHTSIVALLHKYTRRLGKKKSPDKRLPAWVRVVTTSRPDEVTRKQLDPLLDGASINIDCPEHRRDIEECVRQRLSICMISADVAWRDKVQQRICAAANGCFQYAIVVTDALQDDPDMDLDSDSLPSDLSHLYMERFRLTFPTDTLDQWDNHTKPMLAALLVAQEGLPVALLEALQRPSYPGTKWIVQRQDHIRFVLRMCRCDVRPTVGDMVTVVDEESTLAGQRGKIVRDDQDDKPFKVKFAEGDKVGWFRQDQVRLTRACAAERMQLVQLSHKSFADWLQAADNKYFHIGEREGHELMEVFCKGLLIADESGCICLGEQYKVRDQKPVQYAARHWVSHCKSLGRQECAVPSTVTSIADWTFKGCSGLTALTLPDGLTSIGEEAFKDCSGLTALTLPDGLTSIGDWTFQGCSKLTSLTLPDGLTSIGDGAFTGCFGLTALTLPDGITSISDGAFWECSGLTALTLPDGLTSISDGALWGCSGLTTLTLPDGLTSIGERAFTKCSGLTALTLPDGLTSIGEGAFEACSGLTTLTLPDGLTSIGNWAFRRCFGLTTLTLPDGLTSIGERAFTGCSGLTTLTLPDGLTSIGIRAFWGCSGLTALALPDGLTSIGKRAFEGCSGLAALTLPDGLTSIGERAFTGCSGLTALALPDGLKSIGNQAFMDAPGSPPSPSRTNSPASASGPSTDAPGSPPSLCRTESLESATWRSRDAPGSSPSPSRTDSPASAMGRSRDDPVSRTHQPV